ncbi:MAG: TolC family protein [Pirellulales bacterium]
MSLFRIAQRSAVFSVLLVGCRSTPTPQELGSLFAPTPSAARAPQETIRPSPHRVEQASFQETLPAAALPTPEPGAPAGPFLQQSELFLPQLIAEVEARNPSLQAMTAAWQAAAERYPQEVSLDDPMFMTMLAPASWGAAGVQPSYMLQGSQKLPWFGKRALRGQAARAEAEAAQGELQDERVRLVEMVQMAFLDYYLVRRQQELNVRNIEVVRSFREAAEAKYRTNQVTQQDLLQADVELAELERRRIELGRMDRVARARINTLLRVDPLGPLPPPPRALAPPTELVDLTVLQEVAARQRPDLLAASGRVAQEEAAVSLAAKAYYPDVEVIGRYDNFWEQSEVRPAVGLNMNVPLYKGRLDAAVREGMNRLAQRKAELEQRSLDAQYEVAVAYEDAEESRRTVELYAAQLLPIATQNVAVARANYDTNRADFLDLATAQQKLIELSEKAEESLALYHRRLAGLSRAIGGQPTASH